MTSTQLQLSTAVFYLLVPCWKFLKYYCLKTCSCFHLPKRLFKMVFWHICVKSLVGLFMAPSANIVFSISIDIKIEEHYSQPDGATTFCSAVMLPSCKPSFPLFYGIKTCYSASASSYENFIFFLNIYKFRNSVVNRQGHCQCIVCSGAGRQSVVNDTKRETIPQELVVVVVVDTIGGGAPAQSPQSTWFNCHFQLLGLPPRDTCQ